MALSKSRVRSERKEGDRKLGVDKLGLTCCQSRLRASSDSRSTPASPGGWSIGRRPGADGQSGRGAAVWCVRRIRSRLPAGTVLGVTWSSRYGDEMSVDGGISGSRTAESPDHWAVVPKRCRHLERSGDYLSYAEWLQSARS